MLTGELSINDTGKFSQKDLFIAEIPKPSIKELTKKAFKESFDGSDPIMNKIIDGILEKHNTVSYE